MFHEWELAIHGHMRQVWEILRDRQRSGRQSVAIAVRMQIQEGRGTHTQTGLPDNILCLVAFSFSSIMPIFLAGLVFRQPV